MLFYYILDNFLYYKAVIIVTHHKFRNLTTDYEKNDLLFLVIN